ncbi:hypothetical protein NE237_025226 [Protea cynaroides]|uniref:Uncharacterized protein n=1 Tax=Protea cynaroides TaxID=273540 RepID=A0A9Q0K157_9MAGN|nr:hypothetical protein NE237_025226 [Protea cynaroides]
MKNCNHNTEKLHHLFFSLFISFFFFTTSLQITHTQNSITDISAVLNRTTFIVLVNRDSKPSPFLSPQHWYSSLLSSSSSSTSSFIHVYSTLIHGFSATLTPLEAEILEKSHGVVTLFRDSILHLHTTRSPMFLGLNYRNSSLLKLSNNGTDAIIGLVDTGIWPERKSFHDDGLGPVPTRWKGQCEEGEEFNRSNCNRKIIGARFFAGGYDASFVRSAHADGSIVDFRSPRDSDGHGTHVASIAAGAPVAGAEFQGFAGGTARGMAPQARVAVYKVCWSMGCLLSDVCAALEKAVSDGVDIISVSLGSSRMPFHLDLLSIMSFRVADRGVFVAASAGNEGPYPASITNAPPWVMNVGAGTIDRDFPAVVLLGNGKNVSGVSVSIKPRHETTRNAHPLYSSGKITSSIFNFSPQYVQGRIVLCTTDGHVSTVLLGTLLKYAGAAAMIISHGNLDPNGIIAEPHVLPTITVGVAEAKSIQDYIISDTNPTAVILSYGTVPMHARAAPIVASFSSRGPNLAVPGILKPDIIAPGVNILGAWTGAIGSPDTIPDPRRSEFNLMTGTSMACPHVSGVAALIKSVHPNWSPSEIKSALMTTASIYTHYDTRNMSIQSSRPKSPISDEFSSEAASPFGLGAGHLEPERAMDPGLIYDLGYDDYVNFLCGLNYTERQIEIITGKRVFCLENGDRRLNYPAIVVAGEEVEDGIVVLIKRLKVVSEGQGFYKAKVVGFERGDYKIEVEPKILRINGIGERVNFKVMIRKEGKRIGRKEMWVGALIWREEITKHTVRCPIVIYSAKKYIVGL